MKNVLLLTDKLKYACGVTTSIYNLVSNSDSKEIHFILFAGSGDRVQDFERLGIKVYSSERIEYTKKSIFNIFHILYMIFYIVFKHKINIVHSQNYYLANIARLIQKFVKIKTVQTQHNYYSKGFLKQFNADKYIIVNKDMEQYAINDFSVDKNNLYEIKNGLNLPEVGEKNIDKLKVVIITRLIKEKGVEVFLDAVNEISYEIRSKAEFIVAGEGIEEENLIEKNKRLGVGVNFIGKIQGAYSLLKSSHIFVIPSFWSLEGFPISIVEAAFTKNLILASNFRGLTSYFQDKVDGFIFAPKDSNKLKELLENSIENYALYQDMIELTNSKFRREFDIKDMVKKTIIVYNTL